MVSISEEVSSHCAANLLLRTGNLNPLGGRRGIETFTRGHFRRILLSARAELLIEFMVLACLDFLIPGALSAAWYIYIYVCVALGFILSTGLRRA